MDDYDGPERRREDGAIAQLPRIGTVLTVSLGYAETRLVSLGRFIVDEIEMRSPPATLTAATNHTRTESKP